MPRRRPSPHCRQVCASWATCSRSQTWPPLQGRLGRAAGAASARASARATGRGDVVTAALTLLQRFQSTDALSTELVETFATIVLNDASVVPIEVRARCLLLEVVVLLFGAPLETLRRQYDVAVRDGMQALGNGLNRLALGARLTKQAFDADRILPTTVASTDTGGVPCAPSPYAEVLRTPEAAADALCCAVAQLREELTSLPPAGVFREAGVSPFWPRPRATRSRFRPRRNDWWSATQAPSILWSSEPGPTCEVSPVASTRRPIHLLSTWRAFRAERSPLRTR